MRTVKEVQEKLGSYAGAAGAVEEPKNKILGYPARVRRFLHEVRLEMHNVTWPNRPDVQATTVVVIVASVFFSLYLGLALDVPLSRLVPWLMTTAKGWIK
jgi:preprotein translocase SecE subunit